MLFVKIRTTVIAIICFESFIWIFEVFNLKIAWQLEGVSDKRFMNPISGYSVEQTRIGKSNMNVCPQKP